MDERDRAEMERILAAAKPIADRLGLKLTIDPEKAARFRPISGPEDDRVAAWVEAGARALWSASVGRDPLLWAYIGEAFKNQWRHRARACLSASLAAAEADGVVFATVPEPLGNRDVDDGEQQYLIGHNDCRAACWRGR